MTSQSFPEWGSSYGFLTWLNRPGVAPTFCCAPRWCHGPAIGQPQKFLMNGIIGDVISNGFDLDGLPWSGGQGSPQAGPVVSAPPDALIAYGWLARALIVKSLS